MIVIDKREECQKEYTFGDLRLGDCFIDTEGDLGIKINAESYLYTTNNGKDWDKGIIGCTDRVIPLEATLTIIGKK